MDLHSPPSHAPRPLILGSTSRYRHALLQRLNLPFEVVAPLVEESALAHESPEATALRLAEAKAWAVARLHPQAYVIGSDQVANLHNQPLGKPGHHLAAVEQLRAMSGQVVIFHTAVSVVCMATGFSKTSLANIRVHFRTLSDTEIENYLQADQPYDCAGSAKSEGLGIALMQSIESDDPTALIGLPLIRTCALLREAGLALLGAQQDTQP
jgi:septum formation protein